MTTVTIKKTNNQIDSIMIKGHSGYSVSGKDIVCAAISSSAITTVNAILALDDKAIDVKEDEGFLFINTLNNSDNTNKLLQNLVDMLNDIKQEYPKYLKINIEGE